MTDFELLNGVDAARPLPDDLRARLEGLLLADDAPLELGEQQRAQLVAVLPRRRRPPVWIGAGVAAAAAAVIGVVVLNSGHSSPVVPTQAVPAPTFTQPAPLPTEATPPGALTGGVGGGTGGSTGGGVSVPAPTVAPSRRSSPSPAAPPAAGSPDVAVGSASAPFSVTSLRPTSGPMTGGTRVRITGTGLHDAGKVLFAGTPGTKLVVESDSSITVLTPAVTSARSVTVTVVLTYGMRTDAPQEFRYTLG